VNSIFDGITFFTVQRAVACGFIIISRTGIGRCEYGERDAIDCRARSSGCRASALIRRHARCNRIFRATCADGERRAAKVRLWFECARNGQGEIFYSRNVICVDSPIGGWGCQVIIAIIEIDWIRDTETACSVVRVRLPFSSIIVICRGGIGSAGGRLMLAVNTSPYEFTSCPVACPQKATGTCSSIFISIRDGH